MKTSTLRRLLEEIRDGKVEVQEGLRRLRALPFEDLGFAKVDSHRELRVGFPEVIYGEGKTDEQVVAIAGRLMQHGGPVLITRTSITVSRDDDDDDADDDDDEEDSAFHVYLNV